MGKGGRLIFFIIILVALYFIWNSFLSPTNIACKEACLDSNYVGGKCRTGSDVCNGYGEISLSGDYCVKDIESESKKTCCCKESSE